MGSFWPTTLWPTTLWPTGFWPSAVSVGVPPSVQVVWDGTPQLGDQTVVKLPTTLSFQVDNTAGLPAFSSLGLVGNFGTPAYQAVGTVFLGLTTGGSVLMTATTAGLPPGTYLWEVYSSVLSAMVASGKVILEPSVEAH